MLTSFDQPARRLVASPAPMSVASLRAATGSRVVAPPSRAFPVYLVERVRELRIVLSRELTAAGFQTRPFATSDDLAAALPELAPGCVIIDIAELSSGAPSLRQNGGAGVLRYPTIVTFDDLEPDDAVAAVRLGAVDLLRRPAALPELLDALARAAPKVRLLDQRIAAQRAAALVASLSPRERDVMECIMKGLSNKEIARVLGLSPRTIEMHRARLHRRLKVGSLAELVATVWSARSLPS